MIRKPSYDDAADPAKVAHLRIAVLGLGRAGQALAREFADAGLNLTGLWNRSPRSIHPALIGINVSTSSTPPEALISNADVILLAVHDSAIAELASSLNPSPGAVLLHLSGSMGPEALGPLPEGVEGGGYHPLQSFRVDGDPAFPVPPYHLALDGSDEAIDVGRRLAAATGHPHVVLPPEGKAAYHAAAVMTSGCMAALLGTATDAMALAGVPEDRRWPLLWPLAAGTLANLADGGFAASLTGPVARGDAATSRRNLEALAQLPIAADLYRALGQAALRFAEEQGLDSERLAATQEALEEA